MASERTGCYQHCIGHCTIRVGLDQRRLCRWCHLACQLHMLPDILLGTQVSRKACLRTLNMPAILANYANSDAVYLC
jgi:hypothetical protein